MVTDVTLGYTCCLVAGIGFGINFLPVKGIDIGDGIFFSAVMSIGILFVGLLTGTVLSSPPGLAMAQFEPLAALRGSIWMVGNLMCP
ncbi:TMEM144 [Symbiodinium pilosum]|uniref:TMEM144 protein n=1 Tax=Symbiodinium pilosum TaxID=2952 RepID=A0A812Y5X7_SYMPI|nr:TMEM144 [Symbiodinium pilosum]